MCELPNEKIRLDDGLALQELLVEALQEWLRHGRGGSPSRPSERRLPTRNRPARRSGPT